MRRSTRLLLAGFAIGALLCLTGTATAQKDSPHLWLEWPNEGETLYAGPTSLLYKVPIKGYVTSDTFSSNEIVVQLEIFKGSARIGRLQQTPAADGTFEFFVTVNSKGAVEEFPIAFKECGYVCHSLGDLDLQPGMLRLRIRATDPGGDTATVERTITVDLSGYATIPVRAILSGDPDQTVEGVRVSASTRMYLWRARYGLGQTNGDGIAAVRVEALAEAPTRYVFRIDATIVDGVLYRGVAPAEVTLPPGATSAPEITLRVTASRGQINGSLSGNPGTPLSSFSVRAIHLPEGSSLLASVSDQGTFAFRDLPIGQYLIAVDAGTLAKHGCEANRQPIDLTVSTEASVALSVRPVDAQSVTGVVQDAQGDPLPFAWVTVEGQGVTRDVSPESGAYALMGLPDQPRTIVTSAPGYFSRADAVTPGPETRETTLVRRPETRVVGWGEGEVILPAESEAVTGTHTITLERGWLWGHGGEAQPLIIHTQAVDISIPRGRFALEQLAGQTGWFYLLEGQARIATDAEPEPRAMKAGEMLALVDGAPLQPVPLEPGVLAAIRPSAGEPVSRVFESSLEAQLRDRLAQFGIGAAQAVTFITYFLVILVLVLAPLFWIIWQWKRRARRLKP